jgi:hypothetical protein
MLKILEVLTRSYIKLSAKALREVARRAESYHIHNLCNGEFILLKEHSSLLHAYLFDVVNGADADVLFDKSVELF